MEADKRAARFKLRFSIKGVLLFTALAAVGIVAFRDASATWACVWTSLTLLSIFVAILAAVNGGRRRTAFAAGFAICAGAYFLFVVRYVRSSKSEFVAYLATTKAIDFAAEKVRPYDPIPTLDLYGRLPNPSPFPVPTLQLLMYRDFYDVSLIGQCQCALLLGLLGGLLAHGLATPALAVSVAVPTNSRPRAKGATDVAT